MFVENFVQYFDYLLTIQIDGLDSCLCEEGADSRFGTFVTHSKQDTRYIADLVFLC